jgi:hypothetical protein
VQEAHKAGSTSDALLSTVYLSEYINRRNGGVLVAPWELDTLPDEYKDLYRALQQSDAQTKRKNALEGVFAAARRKHPTYRKY